MNHAKCKHENSASWHKKENSHKKTKHKKEEAREKEKMHKNKCRHDDEDETIWNKQKQPHERSKRIGRGGWSVKCKQLIDHILNKEWCEATALAEEYNSSHAFVAMD